MATLAQITYEIRIILKLLIISIIIVSSVFLAVWTTNLIKRVFFPPPPEAPEQKFGRLERVSFPQLGQEIINYQYRINTIEGTLPKFPDRMRVYKIRENQPSILSLQNTRIRLGKLGFSVSETKLSDVDYQWTNEKDGTIIKYNLITNNFDITSDYLTTQDFTFGILPNNEIITQKLYEFLSTLGIDVSDIDKQKTRIAYFVRSNSTLQKVTDRFEAQIARIDLFQIDINVDPFMLPQGEIKTVPIFYPGFQTSTMHFLMLQDSFGLRIVEAHFNRMIVDTSLYSSYPLKTVEQAFEDLQRKNAYISIPPKSPFVDITEVIPGFYLGDLPQNYLLPVVIFKGRDFEAYVFALSDSSIVN